MISSRVERVEESATMKSSKRAKDLISRGVDVINFTLGEPDFDTPANITQKTIDAMKSGETHYSPAVGLPALREAVAQKLRTENKIDTKAGNIMITPGAKQGIFEAMMTLIDEGDEVLLPDPSWVSYDACIRMAGGKTVWIPTDPKNKYQPLDDLSEFITPKTKMIVVNTPCNPTGSVLDKSHLLEIADLAIDHDFFVLSDEIYEKIIYDKKHVSIASLDNMADRTITINGFSKAYAMTGWRLGYLNAPASVFPSLEKIQSHSISNVTTFVQYGGLEALTGPQDTVMNMQKEFKKRRSVLVDGLVKLGLQCDMPDGAFYAYPDVSEFGTGAEITDRLLEEAQVAVSPGIAFGESGKNNIRISYAASVERIEEALIRMEKVFS
ncbi:pyridoxal phosphate-dependent aminotransferase [Methanolapillus ohkumae]|uniref:Aminotransferase n=1 Tax=Methanolapillus ohkumae TaxID=3028298 RepID=A0AA96V629_9EURY|nr:Aspartate aminotransferase [Methanosarcinaceae archaeon Am2]